MTFLSDPDPAPFDPDLGAVSLKRRSVHGIVTTAMSQAAKFVLQFGSQITLAHLLSPAQFGVVAMVYPVLGLVSIFNDLGISQAIIQHQEINKAQLSSLFWVTFSISTTLAFILAASSPVFGWVYHEPKVIGVNIVLSLSLIIGALSLQPAAIMSRRMRFAEIAAIETASNITNLVSAVVAAFIGAGYWSLVIGQVMSSGLYASLLWLRSDWRPSWPKLAPGVGEMLRFGSHITGSNLVGYLNSAADNIMVGASAGSVALGYYDRSYRLVTTPMLQLTAPIGRVAIPILSRLYDSEERYRQTFRQLLQALLFAVTPSLVFAITFAHPLVLIVLGAKWIPTIALFWWMSVSALTIPTVTAMFWLLISQKRTEEQLRYSTITAAMNIVAYAAGLHWGVIGVTKAAAIYSWLVQLPLLLWVGSRSGPIRFRDIAPPLGCFLGSGIASASVLTVASDTLAPHGLIGLMIGLALSYATVALSLLCLPTGRRFLFGAATMIISLRR